MNRLIHGALLVSLMHTPMAGNVSAATPAATGMTGQTVMVTHTTTYTGGSREMPLIRDWVLARSSLPTDTLLGGSSEVRQIRIIHSFDASNDLTVFRKTDDPPLPLPAGGRPGDVIAVEAYTSAGFERWQFEWSGHARGGWINTRYTVDKSERAPTRPG